MGERLLKDFIENIGDLNVFGLTVWKDGEILDQHHWENEKKRNQYSITKSIVSIATGIAVDQGLLSVEDKIMPYFPEIELENPKWYDQVTIRHLLTMTMGQEEGKLMRPERNGINKHDWLKFSMNLPLINKPGIKFAYTNTGPYILGEIISRVAQMTLGEYVQEKIFNPLKIDKPKWEEDGRGNQFAASGIELDLEDLGKVGNLLLEKGQYQGEQIVSSQWIEEATGCKVKTGDLENLDSKEYAYLFWRCQVQGYRADGILSQFCIILDQKQLVIVLNAEEERSGLLLDHIWKYIYKKI